MNWKNYTELSEKTMSTEFHCSKSDERVLHAVMGILTETEELLVNHNDTESYDKYNVLEELGDITWYLAIIAREYNLDYPQITVSSKNPDPSSLVISILKESCKLLDCLKKKLFYNKSMNIDEIKTKSTIIMMYVADYANCFDISLEDSFDVNINKLKSRYGDRFTSERAINRNLEAERDILEGKS